MQNVGKTKCVHKANAPRVIACNEVNAPTVRSAKATNVVLVATTLNVALVSYACKVFAKWEAVEQPKTVQEVWFVTTTHVDLAPTTKRVQLGNFVWAAYAKQQPVALLQIASRVRSAATTIAVLAKKIESVPQVTCVCWVAAPKETAVPTKIATLANSA